VILNAVTPSTSCRKKCSSGDHLTDQTRRRKGIVLDDARILGILREPFMSVLKSLGKPMIDAKGLKRVANSNFNLSFNPGIKAMSRQDRTPPNTLG
jgi:hypothetical protein